MDHVSKTKGQPPKPQKPTPTNAEAGGNASSGAGFVPGLKPA